MLDELKEGARRNPIWFGAVAAITGVQGFFAWEFWGAASSDPAHQLALRALGLGFVAGEVVALDMASRADLASEPKRASTLRALWAVLALTTFTADISALSRVLREGDAPREALAAAFDANQARISDLETRIDRADDPFGNALLSVAAYDAAIAGKSRELAAARAGNARTWRIVQIEGQMTQLQTARAAATEVAGWQEELSEARRAPETHAERPETDATEFEPFATMLTGAARQVQQATGDRPTARVSSEDVRAGMVWIATIAMKLMLTFGVWVGLQRGRGTGQVAPPMKDEPQSHSHVDAPEIEAAPPRLADPARPLRRTHSRRITSGLSFGRQGQRFGR